MKHDKEWFVESVKKNIRTYNNEAFIGIEKLNELVDKLDRLDLPVIPQFVVDYIEKDKAREGGSNVWHALYGLSSSTCDWDKPNNVCRWVFEDSNNVDMFARAYLNDNYTILKEKRYRLVLSAPAPAFDLKFYYSYSYINQCYRPISEKFLNNENYKTIFTESELKAVNEIGFKRDPVEDIE